MQVIKKKDGKWYKIIELDQDDIELILSLINEHCTDCTFEGLFNLGYCDDCYWEDLRKKLWIEKL